MEKRMLNVWKKLTLSQAMGLLALVCIGMLAFGMYLQHVVGLEPCPMCIVQRYALILVAACALFAGLLA
jgi:protein dithiol:quinone oxidoreductase